MPDSQLTGRELRVVIDILLDAAREYRYLWNEPQSTTDLIAIAKKLQLLMQNGGTNEDVTARGNIHTEASDAGKSSGH